MQSNFTFRIGQIIALKNAGRQVGGGNRRDRANEENRRGW